MKLSMPMQIFLAVVLGSFLGFIFPGDQLSYLLDFGKVLIHWVKLIAGPFLFCTILISIIQVDLKWRHGLRVVSIALINTSMALLIAILLSNQFFKNSHLVDLLKNEVSSSLSPVQVPDVALNLNGIAKTFMPPSLFSPLVNNEILLIALISLIFGLAIRETKNLNLDSRKSIINFFDKTKSFIEVMLHWIIKIIPIAVFAIIAATVSKYGFHMFISLSKFALIVTLGFLIQVIFVYGFWIFIVARHSLRSFFSVAKTPVLYSLGVNSSLATLPLTLKALKKLNVSDRSSSLGAGIATNLNNDGIVLYEAMAVIFISYAYGLPMDLSQVLAIAATCVVASVGITGIPEAGFISLSVIVSALGLPIEALPLLLSVDWILARLRSAVNVLSDMALSIAMDATDD